MVTLGHHPQHLRLPILTQTDRASRIVTGGGTTCRILTELKPRVRVYHVLVKTNSNIFIIKLVIFIVLGHEYHPRKNDSVRVGVRIRIRSPGAAAWGAAAEVGGEYESREKDKEAESDEDGVAKAEAGEVVCVGCGGGGGGGGGRRHGKEEGEEEEEEKGVEKWENSICESGN